MEFLSLGSLIETVWWAVALPRWVVVVVVVVIVIVVMQAKELKLLAVQLNFKNSRLVLSYYMTPILDHKLLHGPAYTPHPTKYLNKKGYYWLNKSYAKC